MLIAGLIFFNDEILLLKKCLDSIQGVDRIIAVDGTYQDWPHNGVFASSKEHHDLIRSYQNTTLITTDKPFWHQIDKRNQCLLGDDGDWYLSIDADEEVIFASDQGWPSVKAMLASLPSQVAWVDLEFLHRPDLQERGDFIARKLFKHLPGIHYAKHHAELYDGNEVRTAVNSGDDIETPYSGARNQSFFIYHHKIERSYQRLNLQGAYYRTRKHP